MKEIEMMERRTRKKNPKRNRKMRCELVDLHIAFCSLFIHFNSAFIFISFSISFNVRDVIASFAHTFFELFLSLVDGMCCRHLNVTLLSDVSGKMCAWGHRRIIDTKSNWIITQNSMKWNIYFFVRCDFINSIADAELLFSTLMNFQVKINFPAASNALTFHHFFPQWTFYYSRLFEEFAFFFLLSWLSILLIGTTTALSNVTMWKSKINSWIIHSLLMWNFHWKFSFIWFYVIAHTSLDWIWLLCMRVCVSVCKC